MTSDAIFERARELAALRRRAVMRSHYHRRRALVWALVAAGLFVAVLIAALIVGSNGAWTYPLVGFAFGIASQACEHLGAYRAWREVRGDR